MASKAENVTQLPGTVPETLAGAMARAFGEIDAAVKSASNPHFKSKYADLTAVIETIKPALVKHSLFFTQHPQPTDNGVTVETMLHHASGESLSLGSLFVPANKQDAQGFGSALTYARRYGLVTAFGVPVEDDDGNAASRIVAGGQSSDARSAPGGNTDSARDDAPQGMPDAEWAKLAGMVKATGENTGEMLKYFGVANLRHLNQDQYAEALEILDRKLAEKAAAHTNGQGDKWGASK